DELLGRAEELFAAVHATDTWAWKDPRLCILLPFWDGVLGTRHPIVLVFRHPIAVARSLQRRDRLSKTYALALWERHMRLALQHSCRRRVLVTHYTRIMTDRHHLTSWSQEVVQFLSPSKEMASASVSEAFNAGLRRNRY